MEPGNRKPALVEKVENFLRGNQETRFTARDIARRLYEIYPDHYRQKQERSAATVIPLDSEDAVISQIAREISACRSRLQNRYPQIKTIEGCPRKYYFTQSGDSKEIEGIELAGNENSPASRATGSVVREQDIYLRVSQVLSTEHGVFSKRIDEKRSSNSRGSGGNKWLHPDLVGMEDLGAGVVKSRIVFRDMATSDASSGRLK